MQPAQAPAGYPGAAHTTCTYVSGSGQACYTAAAGAAHCVNHACPVTACANSKSSRTATCGRDDCGVVATSVPVVDMSYAMIQPAAGAAEAAEDWPESDASDAADWPVEGQAGSSNYQVINPPPDGVTQSSNYASLSFGDQFSIEVPNTAEKTQYATLSKDPLVRETQGPVPGFDDMAGQYQLLAPDEDADADAAEGEGGGGGGDDTGGYLVVEPEQDGLGLGLGLAAPATPPGLPEDNGGYVVTAPDDAAAQGKGKLPAGAEDVRGGGAARRGVPGSVMTAII